MIRVNGFALEHKNVQFSSTSKKSTFLSFGKNFYRIVNYVLILGHIWSKHAEEEEKVENSSLPNSIDQYLQRHSKALPTPSNRNSDSAGLYAH